MPIYLPYMPRRRKPGRMPPISPSVRARTRLQHDLTGLISQMSLDLMAHPELLTASPMQFVRMIREYRDRWQTVFAENNARITSRWAEDASRDNRDKISIGIARALGIDFAALIDGEGFAAAMERASAEAARLITSVPEKYISQISEAALANFRGELPGGMSLQKRLREIGGMTESRAKTIARDQTASLNGSFVRARMVDAGISRYEWRAAMDARTVGNPGGLYPDPSPQHGNHWARNGRIFEWAKPPADGHPGMAINCRCRAIAVIDMDELIRG